VLDGRVRAGAFRDKLVVIGVTSTTVPRPDVHRTPLDDDRRMSGPEVQAAALATMIRDMPLRDAGPLADIAAVVLVTCLGVSAVLWRSRILGVLAVIAVAGGFLVVAQLAFHGGSVLAVIPPLCALALAVTGVAAFEIARRIRGASRRV
jgi:CHASE2 domain-containing sensor protein